MKILSENFPEIFRLQGLKIWHCGRKRTDSAFTNEDNAVALLSLLHLVSFDTKRWRNVELPRGFVLRRWTRDTLNTMCRYVCVCLYGRHRKVRRMRGR